MQPYNWCNGCIKKSRIRETPNLSTDGDSSIDVFVSTGVKKGADSIFFAKIASCNDVHFMIYIFSTVRDSFAPLGPPFLPCENRMGMGQQA